MNREQGTLAVGLEYDGRTHKDFILRPQVVKDSIEAMEEDRSQKNDGYFGVSLLTRQIEKLGDIPKEKITPELIMSLTDIDFEILVKAKEALESRLRSFLPATGEPEKAGPGPS